MSNDVTELGRSNVGPPDIPTLGTRRDQSPGGYEEFQAFRLLCYVRSLRERILLSRGRLSDAEERHGRDQGECKIAKTVMW